MYLDLWELPSDRLTATITDVVEANFFSRCEPEKRPLHLKEKLRELQVDDDPSEISPSSTKEEDTIGTGTEKVHSPRAPQKWYSTCFRGRRSRKPKYDASLVKTLYNTFLFKFWASGILKLFSGKLP